MIPGQKKIMTSAKIHKIWWFPKSDFKHFETPVFPLCIYRIFAETNFDISLLFCENATFFLFPGLSSWVKTPRGPANQELFHSDQQGCEACFNAGNGGRSKDRRKWGVKSPLSKWGFDLVVNFSLQKFPFMFFLLKFQVVNLLGWWENF